MVQAVQECILSANNKIKNVRASSLLFGLFDLAEWLTLFDALAGFPDFGSRVICGCDFGSGELRIALE